MKKIIAKLALALFPLAVYLCVFVAFEPNNYFGLRSEGSLNSPISRIRAYQNAPQPNILLGDSRMAHFDMDLVEEVTNESWANLAYGGASLEESIDEFYYIYSQYPEIQRVVMSVSFYTLNANYRTANRMTTVETQLENPVAYVFNLEYNINTLTVIGDKIKGLPDAEETAEYTQADYLPNGARKNLVAYAAILYQNCAKEMPVSGYGSVKSMVEAMEAGTLDGEALANTMQNCTVADSKYMVNEQALSALLEMADFCETNGIALTLVMPAMDESLRTYVCKPLGIDETIAPAIEQLQESPAKFINHEWGDVLNYPDTMYYDGFHLDTKHGLPQYTQRLFSEVMSQ